MKEKWVRDLDTYTKRLSKWPRHIWKGDRPLCSLGEVLTNIAIECLVLPTRETKVRQIIIFQALDKIKFNNTTKS